MLLLPPVPLASVADALPGAALRGDAAIADVVFDSREASPGSLFCCVPGAVRDGHDFAGDAIAAGAAALLVERWLDLPVPQVRVPSVRASMGPAAAVVFGHPADALTTAGITGTNGKTTTTYLLEAIWRAAGVRPGVIGTTGARVDDEPVPLARTTPEAPDLHRLLARMRDAGVGAVAIEVSSHALAQHRVAGVRFGAAAFTNLSQDHLDYHGSMEAYFAAKASLFTPAAASMAVVNADDPWGRRLLEDPSIPTTTFAVDRDADLRATSVVSTVDGIGFAVEGTPVRSELRGAFNVSNCLAALAVARALGVNLATAADGIAAAPRVPGRVEPVEEGQDFLVVVDYAHTPDSIQSVLQAARPLASGRLIVVFGCGGDRDRAKRPLMGAAATGAADLSILTSDNPRSEDPLAIIADIEPGAREGGGDYVVEPDRRAAIALAIGAARGGDVVVIAGKGHEPYQELADGTVPFDDREVAREALAGRGGPIVKPRTMSDVARAVDGLFLGDDVEVTTVCTDSRLATPGSLFVALPGEHTDGGLFVPEAFRLGAAGALVRDGLTVDGPAVSVRSTNEALIRLAADERHRMSATIVAVTGANGKTSTKDMAQAVLSSRFRTHASPESFNNEIGVPVTLLTAPPDTEVVVAELGARRKGDVTFLCAIVEPDVVVVTNVGVAHLEIFGSWEAIVEASAEPVEALGPDGVSVLNADDQVVAGYAARSDGRVVTFGMSGAADVRAEGVVLDAEGFASFDVVAEDGRAHVALSVAGEHMVSNALASIAVGLTVGVDLEAAAAAVGAATVSHWRMETFTTPTGVRVVNDAYNANPESVAAALKAARWMARDARLVAVLGTMAELGPIAGEEHERIGDLAARLRVDRLIAVGEWADRIASASVREGVEPGNVAAYAEPDEALTDVRAHTRAGDVVLFKASRVAGLERLAEALR